MSHLAVPLPARRSEEAPRFDPNDPLSLWSYFIDYERLADAAQLDEESKIKRSVIYLDRDEADFWESLDEYFSNDWHTFKNVVLSFYPGSIPAERWTLFDFNDLCNSQKTKRIRTRSHFAEFDRRFSTISKSLLANGLLSDLEVKKSFWNALDEPFRRRVARKIELVKHSYTPMTILTISEIRDAAALILDDTPKDESEETTPASIACSDTLYTPFLDNVKLDRFDTNQFTHQLATMMAQTVQTAISTVLDRTVNIYAFQNGTSPRNAVQDSFTHSLSTFYGRSGQPPSIPIASQQELVEAKSSNHVPTSFPKKSASFSSLSSPVAFPNVNACSTSSNPVTARNDEPVAELREEPDVYLDELKICVPEDDENDANLEEIINVLKQRLEEKKKTHQTSYQGPQDTSPIESPYVRVRTSFPSQSTFPSTSIPATQINLKLQEPHYYQDRVFVKRAIEEEAFNPQTSLSIEEILALSSDIRQQASAAISNQEEAIETQETGLTNATYPISVYSVEEEECLNVDICQSQHQETHTSSLTHRRTSIAGEVVFEEIEEQESCNEESSIEEFSVIESFENVESLSSSLHVSKSLSDETSHMYYHSPPVKALDTSTCDSTPPVTSYSIPSNVFRAVPIESVVASATIPVMKDPDKKKSRRRTSKFVLLSRYARNRRMTPYRRLKTTRRIRMHLAEPNTDDFALCMQTNSSSSLLAEPHAPSFEFSVKKTWDERKCVPGRLFNVHFHRFFTDPPLSSTSHSLPFNFSLFSRAIGPRMDVSSFKVASIKKSLNVIDISAENEETKTQRWLPSTLTSQLIRSPENEKSTLFWMSRIVVPTSLPENVRAILHPSSYSSPDPLSLFRRFLTICLSLFFAISMLLQAKQLFRRFGRILDAYAGVFSKEFDVEQNGALLFRSRDDWTSKPSVKMKMERETKPNRLNIARITEARTRTARVLAAEEDILVPRVKVKCKCETKLRCLDITFKTQERAYATSEMDRAAVATTDEKKRVPRLKKFRGVHRCRRVHLSRSPVSSPMLYFDLLIPVSMSRLSSPVYALRIEDATKLFNVRGTLMKNIETKELHIDNGAYLEEQISNQRVAEWPLYSTRASNVEVSTVLSETEAAYPIPMILSSLTSPKSIVPRAKPLLMRQNKSKTRREPIRQHRATKRRVSSKKHSPDNVEAKKTLETHLWRIVLMRRMRREVAEQCSEGNIVVCVVFRVAHVGRMKKIVGDEVLKKKFAQQKRSC